MKLLFFLLLYIFRSICTLINIKQTILQNNKLSKIPEIFPETLSDENNDGYSNQNDFINSSQLNQTSTPTYLTYLDLLGIFILADLNKDGLISKQEWKTFYRDSVKEFYNNCDKNNDYLLNKQELKDCLKDQTEPIKDLIDYDKLLSYTTFDGKNNQLNFIEYLKLDNFIDGWSTCANKSVQINLNQFNCSINISHFEVELEPTQLDGLFLTGFKLSRESLKQNNKGENLNFNNFFNLNIKFHRYLKMQKFLNKFVINPKEFLNKNLISYGFEVDFPGFFLMKEFEDILTIYGKTKPNFLNLQEFIEFYKNELMIEIKKLIESCNFEKQDSAIFLKTIFQIFDSNENNYLSTIDLYDLYKYALAFMEIDKDSKYYFFSKALQPFQKNATFILSFQGSEQGDFLELISLNKTLPINYIMFSSILKYKALFTPYIDFRSSSISKENLIKLLPKLGLKFQIGPLEGAEIKENLYEYESAFKLSLVEYGKNINNKVVK